MPTIHDVTAPAASVVNVLSVIRRYRLRDFPRAFDQDALHHVGVPGLHIERTMHALKLLGLLDAENVPTEAFASIRISDSADSYAAALAEVVRSAYAPIFDDVDPASASDADLRSTFAGYDPPEDRERMLSLFIGLAEEAELRGDQATTPRGSPRQRMGSVGRPTN